MNTLVLFASSLASLFALAAERDALFYLPATRPTISETNPILFLGYAVLRLPARGRETFF